MPKRNDDLRGRTNFFISYTAADKEWAVWIAWVLEAKDFSVKIQAWDFVPGSNFVLEMNRAVEEAPRTLAVVSPDYLKRSTFGAPEWAAAFAKDAEGFERQLVPVRVRECQIEGLLKQIVYIDLVGKSESEAERALLDGIIGQRAKPAQKPRFPGLGQKPVFPGSSNPNAGTVRPDRYMPRIRQTPSDLEKRRFVQHTFEVIAQQFEQALNELTAHQQGVDYDLKRLGTTKFTAELFVNGKSRRRCKIWLQNDEIAFSEGPFEGSSDNSYNEMLSLAQNELVLTALMRSGWGNEGEGLNLGRLAPEAAAEYLWRRFTSRLN